LALFISLPFKNKNNQYHLLAQVFLSYLVGTTCFFDHPFSAARRSRSVGRLCPGSNAGLLDLYQKPKYVTKNHAAFFLAIGFIMKNLIINKGKPKQKM